MPYCKSCGAYIPDGQIGCLACGFDESVKQSHATEVQAKKSEQNEEMREILERHRKLQQEKNKQWAESEKARREQQAENRRWAQEEYARRQAEREVEAEQRAQEERERREQERRRRESYEPYRASSSTGNTALAALSYLSVLFVLPFFLTPDDQFARYHAKQGLRLFIFSAIADIIGSIFPIGWILSLFRIYCIFKGISNAVNGRKEPLPYIGTIGKDGT